MISKLISLGNKNDNNFIWTSFMNRLTICMVFQRTVLYFYWKYLVTPFMNDSLECHYYNQHTIQCLCTHSLSIIFFLLFSFMIQSLLNVKLNFQMNKFNLMRFIYSSLCRNLFYYFSSFCGQLSSLKEFKKILRN